MSNTRLFNTYRFPPGMPNKEYLSFLSSLDKMLMMPNLEAEHVSRFLMRTREEYLCNHPPIDLRDPRLHQGYISNLSVLAITHPFVPFYNSLNHHFNAPLFHAEIHEHNTQQNIQSEYACFDIAAFVLLHQETYEPVNAPAQVEQVRQTYPAIFESFDAFDWRKHNLDYTIGSHEYIFFPVRTVTRENNRIVVHKDF